MGIGPAVAWSCLRDADGTATNATRRIAVRPATTIRGRRTFQRKSIPPSNEPATIEIPVLFVRTRLDTGHRLDSAWITSGESSTAFTESVNVLI